MVQCDKCDGWFHFLCVGVDEAIENVEWACDKCSQHKTDAGIFSKNAIGGEGTSIMAPAAACTTTRTPASVKSKSSSKKRAELELQLFEEMMKLAAKRDAEYLAEKQNILEQALSDDSDGEASGDDQQNNNVRTADWVKATFEIKTSTFGEALPPTTMHSNIINRSTEHGYASAANAVHVKGPARTTIIYKSSIRNV